MNGPTRIVSLGDVHFCHYNTPAASIGKEIRECFPYGKWFASIDIMIIDGDWWDKLMPNNHPDVYETEKAIYYILKLCKDTNTTLLVVDGTPLHDAGQMQKFKHINEESGIGCDLYFHDDIAIQYIPKHDMHVLFVPDRPRLSPDEILEEVRNQLKLNKLEQVDLAVMHGCFQYQLPEIADDLKHDEEAYHEIVKGPIIIGHIHTHSTKGRIIAPGSFSRLSHGEEEPKGFIELIMYPDGTFKSQFKENKNATIYKTINVTDLNHDETFSLIQEYTAKLPLESRIRIQCEKGHPIAADKSFQSLKSAYPYFKWSIKVNKTNEEKEVEETKDEVEYTPIVIDKNNITNLLVELAHDRKLDTTTIELIPKYMDTILQVI